MQVKTGVSLSGLAPEMWFALGVMAVLYRARGVQRPVVTSTTEGEHKVGSVHPTGYAVDLRIVGLSEANLDDVVRSAAGILRPWGYDVVLEPDHLHIEYDPREGRVLVATEVHVSGPEVC